MARTFTLTLKADNSAFDADPMAEVADILNRLSFEVGRISPSVSARGLGGSLRDTNGNTVGTYEFTVEGED